MVVEGEKCRNAVARHSKDAVVVAWMGGGKAWKKTDWTPLYGRDLLLVADGDFEGHDTMKALAEHLDEHCPSITLVLPPASTKGGGDDIADVIKAKSNLEAWLNEHEQPYEPGRPTKGRRTCHRSNRPKEKTRTNGQACLPRARINLGCS